MPFRDPAAQKAWSKRYYAENIEWKRRYAREHRAEHREEINKRRWDNYHRGHKVGDCPICGFYGQLDWDHDHTTGQFRDWICGNCNRKLGIYEKNREKFEVYLRRFI